MRLIREWTVLEVIRGERICSHDCFGAIIVVPKETLEPLKGC